MSVDGVIVEPAVSEWDLPHPPAHSPMRAALGIPEGATVIMLGHQALAWHAGIVAKFYLARAAADALTEAGRYTVVVWLTPDHAAVQPFQLRVPSLVQGRLSATVLDLAPPLPDGHSASVAAPVRALRAEWGDGTPALESVRTGVERCCAALEASSGEHSAAKQSIAATQRMLGADAAPDALIYASELGQHGALDTLIDAMLDDPAACTNAYNDAARARPEAGVAELTVGDRVELPLWKLQDGTLHRVFADELPDLPRTRLAPRALTMTLLARRDLCEVFIHGTGGGVYDRVMEDWAQRWLGKAELAPMVVATATRHLPLGALTSDDGEIDRTVWLAHKAKHDPALLGDDAAAKAKQRLLDRITQARAAGGDASPDFQEMHRMLDQARTNNTPELARFDSAAVAASKHRGTAQLASDRTWPLSLFEQSAQNGLAADMKKAAAGLTSPARQRQE